MFEPILTTHDLHKRYGQTHAVRGISFQMLRGEIFGLLHEPEILFLDEPPDVQAAVAQLQPVFEESRYPSGDVGEPIPADLITELDAQQAVRLAEEVRAWVQTLLERPPGSVRGKMSC